jgi:hypothetical protein
MHPQKTAQRDNIEDRRSLVQTLRLMGKTERYIAEQLGVCQATVHEDLVAVREEWKQGRLDDFQSRLDEEMERLRMLTDIAFDAMLQAKSPADLDRFLKRVFDISVIRLRLMGALQGDGVTINLPPPVFQAAVQQLTQRMEMVDPTVAALERVRDQARLPNGLKELPNGSNGHTDPED